ncbi:HdeD family acid-resistance protein [Luteipulveratus flavus]|uniref:DUF308 domain-containing protein n=1 Tax=Luteipulveratus flavus TaxID=3031728 RepID=A0ABT6C1G7_9MICO|nr:DUF308 domain-containing protein [Luteipulveratus sp. YIM 133296]MDF8262699.1 DUF308 domain-containing protein [Luteipulveratus sp. YIM 133296]
MSAQQSRFADSPLPPGVSRVADHWAIVLAYGVGTLLVGLILLVWPDETLVVLAVLLAVHLIVTGAFRIVNAIAVDQADGTVRALLGVTGGLSLIVGLLCLRSPLQTVAILGMLVGAWWVVMGAIHVIEAVLGRRDARALTVFMGLVSIAGGAYLLVNPKLSLDALVLVISIWLLVYGALVIGAGWRLRAAALERDDSSRSLPAT